MVWLAHVCMRRGFGASNERKTSANPRHLKDAVSTSTIIARPDIVVKLAGACMHGENSVLGPQTYRKLDLGLENALCGPNPRQRLMSCSSQYMAACIGATARFWSKTHSKPRPLDDIVLGYKTTAKPASQSTPACVGGEIV